MIKRVDVEISFPEGAYFTTNVDIGLYKRLINFIKKLNCFNIDSKCLECPFKKRCNYYKITGENFNFYSGITIGNNLFEKKHFKRGEHKVFSFYFIGSNALYTDYVKLLFESLNQHIYGNLFYLVNVSEQIIEDDVIEVDSLAINTPIEDEVISNAYNKMIDYYNSNYDCDYKKIDTDIKLINEKKMVYGFIRFDTRKLDVAGFVGEVDTKFLIPQSIQIVGIGKYNFIGGGNIEIKDKSKL